MIFPVADLVPDICAGLSVRDIRAIACVSRDVHGMMAPFMEVRMEEVLEELQICHVTHSKVIWPNLHHTIEHKITIDTHLFGIITSNLAANYTGILKVVYDFPLFIHEMISYIYIRDGMAQCAVGVISIIDPVIYVYSVHKPIAYANFIDKFTIFALLDDIGDGYINRDLIQMLQIEMYGHGYDNVYDFIRGEYFMKTYIQW